MSLCPRCLPLGYCRKTRTRIVSADELKNPEYVRDVRAAAFRLGVSFRRWSRYIVDEFSRYPGWIASWDGEPIELDFDDFEGLSSEYWFRDFCCTPCPAHVNPRVRKEAVRRVIALATILKALHPKEARHWGVRHAANDNMHADNDNDPKKK